MDKFKVIQILSNFDKQGKCVFEKNEFSKLFATEKPKTREETLNRLVKAGVLQRACRGIYVNKNAHSLDSYLIEHIAKALRKGEYNYISLESILSEYGLISQIPIDRLTVMTTGRSGMYKTPYGVIEFTHTKRSVIDILQHIKSVPERPLRIATKAAALRDLKRVGRNLTLLSTEINNE